MSSWPTRGGRLATQPTHSSQLRPAARANGTAPGRTRRRNGRTIPASQRSSAVITLAPSTLALRPDFTYPCHPPHPHAGKPRDGSFWMSFDDFVRGFNKVYVCRLLDGAPWHQSARLNGKRTRLVASFARPPCSPSHPSPTRRVDGENSRWQALFATWPLFAVATQPAVLAHRSCALDDCRLVVSARRAP